MVQKEKKRRGYWGHWSCVVVDRCQLRKGARRGNVGMAGMSEVVPRPTTRQQHLPVHTCVCTCSSRYLHPASTPSPGHCSTYNPKSNAVPNTVYLNFYCNTTRLATFMQDGRRVGIQGQGMIFNGLAIGLGLGLKGCSMQGVVGEAHWATLIGSGRVWSTSGSGRVGWAAGSHGEGPTGHGSHGHSGGTRLCDLHPACGGGAGVA